MVVCAAASNPTVQDFRQQAAAHQASEVFQADDLAQQLQPSLVPLILPQFQLSNAAQQLRLTRTLGDANSSWTAIRGRKVNLGIANLWAFEMQQLVE